jgi:hypothetical protein
MSDIKKSDNSLLEDLIETDETLVREFDLETMGLSEIVYIKPVTSEEIKAFDFETFGDIPDGMKLFAVHTANGIPVALLDDRDTAFAAAKQYEMQAVSVH